MLRVEIVDDDEVEIGGRRHLAAAELAEREQRGLLAPDAAVIGRQHVLDPAVQRADRNIGEPREGAAGLLGRHRIRQHPRADQEHLLLAEHAEPIEKILVGARLLDGARELGLKLGFVRQRAEERRLEQRVHRLRIARQDVGQPRRGAERQRDQRDQIRILLEQREQPRAALQAADETDRRR